MLVDSTHNCRQPAVMGQALSKVWLLVQGMGDASAFYALPLTDVKFLAVNHLRGSVSCIAWCLPGQPSWGCLSR